MSIPLDPILEIVIHMCEIPQMVKERAMNKVNDTMPDAFCNGEITVKQETRRKCYYLIRPEWYDNFELGETQFTSFELSKSD